MRAHYKEITMISEELNREAEFGPSQRRFMGDLSEMTTEMTERSDLKPRF